MRERKHQIKLVLIGYSICLILRAFVLFFNLNFDEFFICSEVDGIIILTSDQWIGQVVLVII